jgi:hypothetical protein
LISTKSAGIAGLTLVSYWYRILIQRKEEEKEEEEVNNKRKEETPVLDRFNHAKETSS